MNLRNYILISGAFILVMALFAIPGVFAAARFPGTTSVTGLGSDTASFTQFQNTQNIYSPAQSATYWPILQDVNQGTCQDRQDLILQVAPAGCQPVDVRSDLLAQQNVPVFCQLDAIQVNPLIDIKQLQDISFTGNYPSEVVGVGFHPANAALLSQDQLMGSPVINNVGYAVVVLKQNPVEKTLPDSVNVTLTGTLDYNSENAFGIGKADFFLTQMSDKEWEQNKYKNTFWNGKYFIRLIDADDNYATVAVYAGDQKISTVRLQNGGTSNEIYVPGGFCAVGLKVQYNGYQAAQKHAVLQVSDGNGYDMVTVYPGSTFLDNACTVQNINVNPDNTTGNVQVYCSGGLFTSGKTMNLQLNPLQKSSVNSNDLKDSSTSGNTQFEKYFNNAIGNYTRIVTQFPSANSGQTAEEAIQKGQELISEVNPVEQKSKSESELLNSAINSKIGNTEYYQNQLSRLTLNTSRDSNYFQLNGIYHTITLSSLSVPKEKPNIYLTIGTTSKKVSLGDKLPIGQSGGYILLSSLSLNSALVQYQCSSTDSIKRENLQVAYAENICDTPIKLTQINAEKVASVTINPVVQTQGTTNVTVNIGIEKRAIQLSPDKTKEMINNINDSIKHWQSISDKLGTVVKGLKGACLATAGILTAKNFLTGLSGETLARQKVMQGPNGWDTICKQDIAKKKYSTMTECFNDNSDKIDSDVQTLASIIQQQNTVTKTVESQPGVTTSQGGILSSSAVNTDKARTGLISEIETKYGSDMITLKNKSTISVNKYLGKYGSSLTYQNVEDFRLNLVASQTQGASSTLTSVSNSNIQDITSLGISNYQVNQAIKSQEDYLKKNKDLVGVVNIPSTTSSKIPYRGGKLDAGYYGVKSGSDLVGSPAQVVTYNNVPFLVVLNKTPQGNTYTVKDIYPINSQDQTIDTQNDYLNHVKNVPKNKLSQIQSEVLAVQSKVGGSMVKIDASSYQNKYLDPEVIYYETDPYKGLPAIVPLDVNDGWYVATQQEAPAFGGTKAIQSNGNPVSFWICNVMANGIVDFQKQGFGDDQCEQFNMNTGQSLSSFPGLSQQETQSLITQAVQALKQAESQYKSGVQNVVINGQAYKVGAPAANTPGVQCQDFMSPQDCKLLFNVCDPVICPASRCNLGGAYPVSNVIQTGIIGSALLCLPNFKEGIAIPVCLTGIKAGIDSYLSILKSHMQCLQTSLDTGQTVGICDEIYSVYTCNFFWNQVAPLANLILPKLVGAAFGQNQVQGGGEYLTVMNAWQNMQQSINYFTQTYAVNSLQAFNARDIQGVGSEFCKSFVSAQAPTELQSILQPNSPPQFYATFSTQPYTDATVPATSMYKVYYHIFAGNNSAVQYSVYLKAPTGTSYYYTNPMVQVDSGFLSGGQTADQTKTFTAPEGYKQLCVSINGQEHCGFGQVTTDFAVNYLTDQYTANEINNTDITTESGCISGSPNAAALLTSPNLQAGATSAVSPQVSNQGIVRICSTDNPGSTTDPTRYVNVGYCGDQRVICWLDKNSVSGAISANDQGVLNETLQELSQDQQSTLGQSYVQDAQSASAAYENLQSQLGQIKTQNGNQKIAAINGFLTQAITLEEHTDLNNFKAKMILLEGNANSIAAEYFLTSIKPIQASSSAQTGSQTSTSPTNTAGNSNTNTGASTSQTSKEYDLIGLNSNVETSYNEDTALLIKDGNDFLKDSTGKEIYLLNGEIGVKGGDSTLGSVSENEISLNEDMKSNLPTDTQKLDGAIITGSKVYLSDQQTSTTSTTGYSLKTGGAIYDPANPTVSATIYKGDQDTGYFISKNNIYSESSPQGSSYGSITASGWISLNTLGENKLPDLVNARIGDDNNIILNTASQSTSPSSKSSQSSGSSLISNGNSNNANSDTGDFDVTKIQFGYSQNNPPTNLLFYYNGEPIGLYIPLGTSNIEFNYNNQNVIIGTLSYPMTYSDLESASTQSWAISGNDQNINNAITELGQDESNDAIKEIISHLNGGSINSGEDDNGNPEVYIYLS